jgi:hypothetical protein
MLFAGAFSSKTGGRARGPGEFSPAVNRHHPPTGSEKCRNLVARDMEIGAEKAGKPGEYEPRPSPEGAQKRQNRPVFAPKSPDSRQNRPPHPSPAAPLSTELSKIEKRISIRYPLYLIHSSPVQHGSTVPNGFGSVCSRLPETAVG